MQSIKNIVQNAVSAIYTRWYLWRLDRLHKALNGARRYWQCAAVGGRATIQLGYMSRKEAIKMVNELRDGPIVYVDDERGFIAFGEMPEQGERK